MPLPTYFIGGYGKLASAATEEVAAVQPLAVWPLHMWDNRMRNVGAHPNALLVTVLLNGVTHSASHNHTS